MIFGKARRRQMVLRWKSKSMTSSWPLLLSVSVHVIRWPKVHNFAGARCLGLSHINICRRRWQEPWGGPVLSTR